MKKDHITGARTKIFSNHNSESVAELPMQIAIWNNPTIDHRFVENGPLDLKELAPISSETVVLHPDYLPNNPSKKLNNATAGGAGGGGGVEKRHHSRKGYVVAHNDNSTLTIKIAKYPPEPSFGLAIANSINDKYFPTGAVAKIVGLRPDVLGRVLGSLSVDVDRNESYDLGLRLKINEASGGEKPSYVRVLGFMRVAEDANPNTSSKTSTVSTNAWISERDAVRIIGSGNPAGSSSTKASSSTAAAGGGGGPAEKAYMKWELSVKGVQLLKAYMTKFPAFFQALSMSTDRFLNASSLFSYDERGPVTALSEIVEWLASLDVMKLPRANLTTDALPSEAVQAIQKAADVRTDAFAKTKLEFENIEVPLTSLCFAPNLTTLRDVQFNYNKTMGGPELGDRVVNIHATSVPFGIRGTVIARHFHSSAVEVVFDEVFVGGNALQGMCDKFRGKLLPWSHLLKIPPNTPKTAAPAPATQAGNKAAMPQTKPTPSPPTATTKTQAPKQVDNSSKKNVKKVDEDDDDEEEVVMVSPRVSQNNNKKAPEKKEAPKSKANKTKEAVPVVKTSPPPPPPTQRQQQKQHQPSSNQNAVESGTAPVLNENVRNFFVGFDSSSTSVVKKDEQAGPIEIHEVPTKSDDASAALLSMLKQGNAEDVKTDDASAALLSMLKQGNTDDVKTDDASAALLSMLKPSDAKPVVNQRTMYREAKRPEEGSLGFKSGGRGKANQKQSNGPAAVMLSESDILSNDGMDPLQELLANAQFEDGYGGN
jgi:5'-3' exoribonuclease 1